MFIKPSSSLSLLLAVVGTLSFSTSSFAQCERANLIAQDSARDQLQGNAVSLHGDLAIVGAPGDGSRRGAAYVYRRQGGQWVEEQKLLASDGQAGDFFATSVAVYGDVVAIGAQSDEDAGFNTGAVYVFRHDGNSFVQEAKLAASDPQAGNRLGASVALDADTLLAGAPGNDEAAIGAGAAYIYTYDGSTWSEVAKLLPPDAGPFDEFALCASLAGDVAVVGAPSHASFDGAAYVFEKVQGSWALETKLEPSVPLNTAGSFGFSVSVHQDVMAVGAPFSVAGTVYVYRKQGASWVEEQILGADDADANAYFGNSVGLAEDSLVVGSVGDDQQFDDAGAAYRFVHENGEWTQALKLLASESNRDDAYGYSVAHHLNEALVGAPWHNNPFNNGGAGSLWDFDAVGGLAANYGQGWPGSFGVPEITALDPPNLGDSIRIEITNSLFTQSTSGTLFIGVQSTSQDTALGGTLLVIPTAIFPIQLPAFARLVLQGTLPTDPVFLGVSVFLQALETDPGASHGTSFTPGLELILGEC